MVAICTSRRVGMMGWREEVGRRIQVGGGAGAVGEREVVKVMTRKWAKGRWMRKLGGRIVGVIGASGHSGQGGHGGVVRRRLMSVCKERREEGRWRLVEAGSILSIETRI